MFKHASRVYETSVTTGTGTYTLDGAAAGFQSFSAGIGANNYCDYVATDDTNWEIVRGQFITGPNRLTRDTILASSAGGAAVNWGAGTRKLRVMMPGERGLPKLNTKSIAGSGDITLTQDEQRCDILILTGALTGARAVIVDDTAWRWSAILNNTTGSFPVTVKVSGQTGIGIAQGARVPAVNDGTDVRLVEFLPKANAYNAIIGGDFSTNPWQRGTSFTSVASGTISADRWKYEKVGAMVHDVSKSADAPTVAQAGVLATHCLLIDCTTVDAAIAAGDYASVQQRVEGYRFIPLAQGAMAFQFWHKHTKTGTYCVAFQNAGSDRSYVAEYAQAVSDAWELATVVIPASPSAGTWDYTTGIGLSVHFVLAAGSTFHTAAGAWQTGAFIATSNQVNACDSVANNFRIALVQLEPGSVCTRGSARGAGEELVLSQRFYEKSFPLATAPAQNAGLAGASTAAQVLPAGSGGTAIGVSFMVEKRATPSITLFNPSAANAQIRNSDRLADWSSCIVAHIGTGRFSIDGTAPAATFQGDRAAVHWAAEVEL